MHEALFRSQLKFDKQTILKYEDVQVITETIDGKERTYIRILIKSPKEDRIGRDMSLEIFGNDTFLCPVRAINRYLYEINKKNKNASDNPFFLSKGSKGYTGREFNTMLSLLTNEDTENSSSTIRSHSLRAGVPSELAKRGADPYQIQGVRR